MSQYHKAIFIQNSLDKNSTRAYLLNLSNPDKSVVSAGKLLQRYTASSIAEFILACCQPALIV